VKGQIPPLNEFRGILCPIIMTVIEVDEKDLDEVFEILLNNGRFTGLPNNRFRIDEHAEAVLEKIKQAGIKVRIMD